MVWVRGWVRGMHFVDPAPDWRPGRESSGLGFLPRPHRTKQAETSSDPARCPSGRLCHSLSSATMRILLACLVALVLAGCGGGESEGGDDSAESVESPESGEDGGQAYDDIEAVAEAAECEEFDSAPNDAGSLAAESGGCTLPDGSFVTINWFDDNGARDEFTSLGTTGGGIMYVVGDKWNIEVPGEEAVVDSLVESTGGEKVTG
jgi:hypothetical protein